MSATTEHVLLGLNRAVSSAFELPGRVALAWAGASGMLAGGVWVAALVRQGRASSSTSLIMTTAFFILFGGLGFVHGGVLGYLGRPHGYTRWQTVRSMFWAALLGAPVLLLLWELSVWVSISEAVIKLQRPVLQLGIAISWLILLGVCATAVVQGMGALRAAYARWPDARLGTLLVAATFGFVLMNFLSEPPVLWGSNLRFTGAGALLLAAGVTAWIASPVIVLALQLLHRRWHHKPRPYSGAA
jgi:hypothetical protein